jgi:flagellar FliL protein
MADSKKDDKDKKEVKAEDSPEEEAKKRKRKLLIIAIAMVLLLVGGGVGAFVFLKGGKKAQTEAEKEISAKDTAAEAVEGGELKAEENSNKNPTEVSPKPTESPKNGQDESKKEDGDKKAEALKEDKKDKIVLDIDFGETIKMATFNINLGNSLENRYVRMDISLEYKGGEATKLEIEKRMPQLRDSIIGILQRKTREFLLAPDGKEALRIEILTRINRYMKAKVDAVYITDMLIE